MVQKVIIILIIVSVYMFLRLYEIRDLPIFLDEAIYSRWAQQGFFNADDRLISLSDGKQPLFIWLTSLVMSGMPNPLAAGRIVSILSGLATAVVLFLLTRHIYKSDKAGYIAAGIFILWPLALILNRLALYESILGLLLMLSLYVQIIYSKKPRLDTAFILGGLFGLLILTKTNGLVSFLLLPVTYLMFGFKKGKYKKAAKWGVFSLVAYLTAFMIGTVLLLSSKFELLFIKNREFSFTLSEVLNLSKNDYTAIITKNFQSVFSWEISYITIPLFIVIVLTILFTKSRNKIHLYLLLWFIFPFSVYILFGKVLYPRYLYTATLPLLPIAGFGTYKLLVGKSYRLIRYLFIALVFITLTYVDFAILTNLARAPIPKLDIYQYATGWPAGDGISEITEILQKEAEKQKIAIISEGVYSSLPTTSMEIYFTHNTKVELSSFEYQDNTEIPDIIMEKTCRRKTFVIVNRMQKKFSYPAEIIYEKQKGGAGEFIRLYTIDKSKLECTTG